VANEKKVVEVLVLCVLMMMMIVLIILLPLTWLRKEPALVPEVLRAQLAALVDAAPSKKKASVFE